MRHLSLLAILALLAPHPSALGGVIHQEEKLIPPDGGDGDNYGLSVSIDGDVALVGAVFHDGPGIDAGAAYVYRFDGNGWRPEQILAASDAEPEDRFGRSVSIDGNVAVIGAYRSDDAGEESGSAYVFRFDGANWIEEQKLTAGDAAPGDRFGCGVSVDGDVALIGAYRDGPVETGSAYVFRFDGGRWLEQQRLAASVPAPYDYFGFSVSIRGEIALVGCECDDDMGTDSGSAYLYRFDGVRWALQATLTAEDGAPDDYFGHYVGVDGGVAVVGAYGDDDAGETSGSAYVFREVGGSWTQEQKLTASDAASEDYYGWGVSVRGDLALIGAPWKGDNGGQSGAAYIYRHDGAGWVEAAKLLPSDGAAHDLFGYAGHVGDDHVIVGAPGDDAGGIVSGSAYIFPAVGAAGVDGGSGGGNVPPGPILQIRPNPSDGDLRISGRRSSASSQSISVHDAAGRLVRILLLDPANGTAQWDGRDAGNRRVPPGSYFVRIDGGNAGPAARVVVLPR